MKTMYVKPEIEIVEVGIAKIICTSEPTSLVNDPDIYPREEEED